jgi:hypothetical protein
LTRRWGAEGVSTRRGSQRRGLLRGECTHRGGGGLIREKEAPHIGADGEQARRET